MSLCAPKLPGDFTQVETRHLVLQSTERDAEIAGRSGDVPVGLLERPQDEVALECVAGLLEQRVAGRWSRIQLGEVVLERQVLVGDPLLVAYRDEALDEVFQLTNVSWPPVRRQDLQCRTGDPANRLSELCLVPIEKQPGKLREIFDAIAQRRHPDRDYVDSVIQIFAEPSVFDGLLQIDV